MDLTQAVSVVNSAIQSLRQSSKESVSARRMGSIPVEASIFSAAAGVIPRPPESEFRSVFRLCENPAFISVKNVFNQGAGMTVSGRISTRSTAESTFGVG